MEQNETIKSQPSYYNDQMALRFSLALPNGYKSGCVYVESAPFLEKRGIARHYDWQKNKIILQLNSSDIDSILDGLTHEYPNVKITRSFDDTEKSLNLYSENYPKSNNTFVALSLTTGTTKLVYEFSDAEVTGLIALFTAAKARIYGW